jgi:hypothetical protein
MMRFMYSLVFLSRLFDTKQILFRGIAGFCYERRLAGIK